jgi:hypothetical protein
MYPINYVLEFEGRDNAYTMRRDLGIGEFPNVGKPKKGNARPIVIQTQIDQPL